MKIINKLPKDIGEFKEIEIACSKYDSEKEGCKKLEIPNCPVHNEIINWIKKNVKKDSSILELASGAFPIVGIQLHQNYQVYLSDISEELMKRTQEKLIDRKIENIRLYVLDAENIPFKDNNFEVVSINAAFHHLPDYKKGIKEMRRVVKKEGYIIISFEPNRWHLITLRSFIRLIKKIFRIKKKNKNFSIADYDTKGFTKKDFKKIAKENNLEIIFLKRLDLLRGFYSLFIDYFLKFKGNEDIYFNQNSITSSISKILTKIDNFLLKIPLLNKLCWQWTIIYKKK